MHVQVRNAGGGDGVIMMALGQQRPSQSSSPAPPPPQAPATASAPCTPVKHKFEPPTPKKPSAARALSPVDKESYAFKSGELLCVGVCVCMHVCLQCIQTDNGSKWNTLTLISGALAKENAHLQYLKEAGTWYKFKNSIAASMAKKLEYENLILKEQLECERVKSDTERDMRHGQLKLLEYQIEVQ